MLGSSQRIKVSINFDINEYVVTIMPPILVQKLDTSQKLIDLSKIDKSNQE